MCALIPSSHRGLPGSTELPGGSNSRASQLSLVSGARAGEKSTIGHTSTAPYLAAGMSRASANASSRFSASNT
jgi:hypothetical protein